MMDELREGKIIELGEIGNFQITVNSEGVETEEEATTSLVKRASVTFRPAIALKDMLQTMKYRKVS
jgi:nucleoid DNA-binding protein